MLDELHTAISRGEGSKAYVQNLLAQQKDNVWSLSKKGAVMFVGGDGSKMEPDVKATLMSIWCEKTGGNTDAASKWIDEMGQKNRYVLDVWAGG